MWFNRIILLTKSLFLKVKKEFLLIDIEQVMGSWWSHLDLNRFVKLLVISTLNSSYFNTLWGRFKRVSKLIEQDQTLYSFRHSGAIEIFKRTGSIHKLQRAMGHSSLNVSLTYLRGLEVAELEENDMPMIL